MERFTKGQVQISASFCILLAAAALLIPVQWVAAWLIAAAIHELAHYTAIRCCGCSIYVTHLHWGGARMETEPLGKREWICALAGPASGFAMLLLSRWFPRIAVCAMVQSLYNLLPLYPMDGGRVMAGLLQLILPEITVQRIMDITAAVIILAGFILSVYVTVSYQLGPAPVILMLGLLYKSRFIKFPCKDGVKRVQ